MAGILDADTHIAEPIKMWDYLDPESVSYTHLRANQTLR